MLTADLSAFGGAEALPLEEVGDNTYVLKTAIDVDGPNGLRLILVNIEQGPHRTRLTQGITILPGFDEIVFSGAADPTWAVQPNSRISQDPDAPTVRYQGRAAPAFTAAFKGLAGWRLEFVPPQDVDPAGYKALRFAFHPGNLEAAGGGLFSLDITSSSKLKSKILKLLEGNLDHPGVDLAVKDWQVVEIPLAALELPGPIGKVRFFGNVQGTFYLDDIRLVTEAVQQPATAVLEEHTPTSSDRFEVGQNYPNPFNRATVIRFTLPTDTEVDLAVHNMAGQRVATLIEGMRPAGIYSVRWDGRDDGGVELASGLYLYKLQAGVRLETCKMLLLR